MKKVTTLVLMLCLVFSGALCYAHDIARTEKEKVKGIPLEVKEKVLHGSFDKSGSIVPTLDGHMLTVILILMGIKHGTKELSIPVHYGLDGEMGTLSVELGIVIDSFRM